MANLTLALVFLVAFIFAVIVFRANVRDRRDYLTLAILRRFQTREFAELMHYIANTKIPVTLEEFRLVPVQDQVFFSHFAQEMESLGMLVAEQVIDIDLVNKSVGSLITSSWGKCSQLFLDTRKKDPGPFPGKYFQWLAERINAQTQISPQQPLHRVQAGFISDC